MQLNVSNSNSFENSLCCQ